jgi:hypothetical protein
VGVGAISPLRFAGPNANSSSVAGPGRNLAAVAPSSSIRSSEGSRIGLDRIATIGSYRYRFIGTPADGDWLIVTAS